MKRYLAVLVLAAFCSGCVALQRTPDVTVLQSLRTVAVIPVESSGQAVPPSSRAGGGGLCCVGGLGGPGAGAVVGVAAAVVLVYAIYKVADAQGKAVALPDGTLAVERGLPADSGMLTVDLARAAADSLRQHAGRTVYLVDGYLQLPRGDPSSSSADGADDVFTQVKRWYNEDVTRIDYSSLKLERLDAILEVGIIPTELLQVMVRLVDPTTKQVLGRAREWSNPGILRFLRSTKEAPRDLVTQCLKDLGLLGE